MELSELADRLAQVCQLGGKGGELDMEPIFLFPERLNLLLLSDDQRSEAGWCCQPIRFWNLGRRGAHHRGSLPEMQPVIKLQSRGQQDRWSLRAVPTPKRIQYFWIADSQRLVLQSYFVWRKLMRRTGSILWLTSGKSH